MMGSAIQGLRKLFLASLVEPTRELGRFFAVVRTEDFFGDELLRVFVLYFLGAAMA
jgi:hypothetical protein